MRRGIVSCRFLLFAIAYVQNFWVQEHRQVYLIGNPIVWWSSSLGVLAYIVARGLMFVRAKRGYSELQIRKLRLFSTLDAAQYQPRSPSTTKSVDS